MTQHTFWGGQSSRDGSLQCGGAYGEDGHGEEESLILYLGIYPFLLLPPFSVTKPWRQATVVNRH